MRASATRPRRSTRIAIETLSIESRLTAERSGTGSSPGSRRTSLGRFRMVVVHGAMSARRWRGMTASRDKMTTGLRPISGISHHHTSPRPGRSVMRLQPPVGTRPSLPTRRVHRAGAHRRRRSWRPPRPSDGGPATQRGLRPPAPSLASRTPCGRSRGGLRPRSCSGVCDSCHNYATGGHGSGVVKPGPQHQDPPAGGAAGADTIRAAKRAKEEGLTALPLVRPYLPRSRLSESN